ncbi:MAG: aldolase/citrate lyase family protein [Planctomycetota bacterium]|nr:aldolase/citrate lyase family protein [Planctomycetota bacterium]
MSPSDSFRSRLKNHQLLLGTMLTLPSAAAAEILADAGFDWIFVDGEHGPFEVSHIEAVLQAIGDRVTCLVRVPEAAEVPIKKVLDLGAEGIIVPQVRTAEQAANVVRFARYAPDGERGVGIARAHRYGKQFNEYILSAKERTVVVVQIEHIEGVEAMESILKVPGIDAILVGPYDLSASLGCLGQLDDPRVVAAMDATTNACRLAGMPLGYFGVNAAAVRPFIDRGYTLITAGIDTMLLGNAASRLSAELRAPR